MVSQKVRIAQLEGELGEYRAAFEALLKTKVELAAAIEGQPTREQLVIEVARLREAIWWLLEVPGYSMPAKSRLMRLVALDSERSPASARA